MTARYEFTAELWEWSAKASWYFVTLPHEVADEIDDRVGGSTAGFGSIRVDVTIGATSWATSIFPSKEAESYVLPIKKPVRRAEGLEPGSRPRVELSLALD